MEIISCSPPKLYESNPPFLSSCLHFQNVQRAHSGVVVNLACAMTLCCLILLAAAHEKERSHFICAEAGAVWSGHCGSATEGEFSNMTNSEAAFSSFDLCTEYH